MRDAGRGLEAARKIADAVLYEGYLLYPYRASAVKNQVRWQFGVFVPPGFTSTEEPSACQTECLVDGGEVVHVRSRFLHVQARTSAAGEPFDGTNTRAIRPGLGLAPRHAPSLLERRARQAIKRGTALDWSLVE